ncbi:MAG: hypothetical protein A2816_00305 [Candidatus Yanofskybacteria bacterium RIFCSPHIGHO2_01_FULL_39_44]|nr:MAG: hypothetical protein A2816_00305 [Candidatus Yanofskybacteria bacterium RIFCSPHIGHO2_01_FULL_39_44]
MKINLKKIKNFVLNWDLNKLLAVIGVLALIIVIVFFIWWQGAEIEIKNLVGGKKIDNLPKGVISGLPCENSNHRPISIMMAADPKTRPLSGISEADIVFEMPVTPNGITRFMAIFQCNNPSEIGSIRSARNDFIPLAAGLKSIYVHWGGEREALQKLNGHIIDNIDAMKYEGTVFYRKNGILRPHNGFTDLARIIDQSQKLGYELNNSFGGYLHEEKTTKKSISNLTNEIKIDYLDPYSVKWIYDSPEDVYKRDRDGKPELDRNTNEQVSVKVVVVIKTTSQYINQDYISVKTQGDGEAIIYQGGISIPGKWQKDPSVLDSKLYFYDNKGGEIKFLPGKIWVEIVTN